MDDCGRGPDGSNDESGAPEGLDLRCPGDVFGKSFFKFGTFILGHKMLLKVHDGGPDKGTVAIQDLAKAERTESHMDFSRILRWGLCICA